MKRVFSFIFIVLLLVSGILYASDMVNGKIAIASDGRAKTASVSNQAGRCPYYLIFNSAEELIEIIDNPHKDAGRGAGTSVVNLLAQKGVKIVITETFGSKMIAAMKSKDINKFEIKGHAENAIKEVLRTK